MVFSRPLESAWPFRGPPHNGRVHKLAGALLGVLILLNGCAGRSGRVAPSLPQTDWQSETTVTNEPVIAPVVTEVPVVIAPPVTTAPPTAAIAPVVAAKWVSLTRWAVNQGLPPMRRFTADKVEHFALVTPQGILTVRIGQQVARWGNFDLHLGFAPQFSSGEVLVHALDLRKNIEPLVRGFLPNTNPDRLVVIDPGHGGVNDGTVSIVDKRNEKEFALDWALRLAPLLQTNGWRVLLTRTANVDVSLADRVAFAEKQRADLFVSLHFNSSGSSSREPAGLETYCLTPTGMASSLTRGREDNAALAFPNNAHDEQNLMYAVRLHAALLKVNGHLDRGVRRARFLTVLQGQNRPAVLIEGGFLSNPNEARRVADPAFRQRLAEAVAEALR